MNCEFCQSPVHIWFQCPKKPDGWKPARLAKVRIGTPSPDRPVTPKSDVSAFPPRKEVHPQSTATRKDGLTRVGSQETGRSGSRPELVEARLPQHATEKPPAGTQALSVDTPKRGRPSTGFDKRAYNKQYMADRRAGKR